MDMDAVVKKNCEEKREEEAHLLYIEEEGILIQLYMPFCSKESASGQMIGLFDA